MSHHRCEVLKLVRREASTGQQSDEPFIKEENCEWEVADCNNNLDSSLSEKDGKSMCSSSVSYQNSNECEVDSKDFCKINHGINGNDISNESQSSSAAHSDLKHQYGSDLTDSGDNGSYIGYYYTSDSFSNTSDKESEKKFREMKVYEKSRNKNKKLKKSSKPQQKRKRGFANPDNWEKNRSKQLRNSGLSYVSCSSGKKVFAAKKVLPPCTVKCKLKCYEKFSESERQKRFQAYWGLASLQKQRDFLFHSMSDINPKYRYAKENSNRRLNSAFFFELRGEKIRVCKRFFKSTLGINDRPIRTVLYKKEIFCGEVEMISSDFRGKHGKHPAIDERIKDGVRNHIKSIPRIPGHYCHSTSSKEYVLRGKSIADLYRDYENSCKKEHLIAVNYTMFARIFKEEFNLAFFDPKKAHCGLCVAYVRDNERKESEDSSSEQNEITSK